MSVFELAISQTSDPTGAYFIYRFGPGTATGDFADFPQMGMDLNSIILTYNDFFLAGGLDARTAAIAKAYLYNGLAFSVPLFGGGTCGASGMSSFPRRPSSVSTPRPSI